MKDKKKQERLKRIKRQTGRIPVPPPSRPHSGKKGDKGYDRSRDKAVAREELENTDPPKSVSEARGLLYY